MGLPLPQPYYQEATKREQLRRVLNSIAIWNPRLGYHPAFAQFAAHVLAVVAQERTAFRVLVGIYECLRLNEYYMQDQAGLHLDVQHVLHSLSKLWPGIIAAFDKHGCRDELVHLVKAWLLSLLAGARIDDGPFPERAPLLHRLIVADDSSEDPRCTLRHIVISILGWRHLTFERASSKLFLVHACRELSLHVPVERPLLDIVDAGVSIEPCARVDAATWMPLGLSLGWFGGLHTTSWLSGVHPTLGPLTAHLAGVYLAAGACGALGAVSALALGGECGWRFAHFAVQELLSVAEEDELERRARDADESSGRALGHHASASGTGAELLLCSEASEASEASEELDFDFFLGGVDPSPPLQERGGAARLPGEQPSFQ